MRYFPLIVAGWLLSCLAPASSWAQKLECKPCSHSFGNVQIGTPDSYSIELSNIGTKELTIQSASKQGALAFSLDNLSLPLRIKAGESVQLTIVFAPKHPGQKTGVFELVSTAENRSLRIDVSGVAEANTKTNAQPESQSGNSQFRKRGGGIECQPTGYSYRFEGFRNHLLGPVDEL